ncbi:MAG: SPOR domain-containing protein [Parvularculaceae bacterium]|nr:SPOR domain-containing protein [Parvularculaceae bacterium]
MVKPILHARIKAAAGFLCVISYVGPAHAQSLAAQDQSGRLEPNPDLTALPAANPISNEPAPLSLPDPNVSFVAGPGYAVHLASYYTTLDAERGWDILIDQHPSLLSGYEARFSSVDLGARGEFVRLFAGPLPDRAEAHQLCEAIRDAGAYCLPANQDGALLNLEDHGR